MAGQVEVKARGAFAYKGKFLSGRCSVSAVDVLRLVKLGLIEPPTEVATAAPANAEGTPLPKDFPAREALEVAGFKTLESLAGKTKDELTAVKGVGPATADKILAALGKTEE